MTRAMILFGVFAAVLFLVLTTVSHAQVSPALAQKAPDAAEIAGVAEKTGYVRIIAEFTGPAAVS